MIARAVLYDFDGTLADTTELLLQCYRHTMGAHLGRVPPDEEWIRGFGTTLEAQLSRFARTPDEGAAMLATYRTFQRQHHDALVRVFPGAVEVVAELVRRGIGVAIVTSKFREGTLRGLELCGLLDYIPVVVTPEVVTRSKPHPEPVLHALAELGVDEPAAAIFVGDSPHDMAAGRAAGTRTAAALWGPFPRAALEGERPDFWLETHGDLLAVLD